MRRAAYAALLLAAALAAGGCGGGGGDGAGRLADYHGAGFSVRYPASYTRSSAGTDPNVRLAVGATPAGHRSPEAVVQVRAFDDPGSLDRAADDFVTIGRRNPGFRVLASRKTVVRGAVPAYRVRTRFQMTDPGSGAPMWVEQEDVLTDIPSGKRLDVRFLCRSAACPRYRGQSDAVLGSVTVDV